MLAPPVDLKDLADDAARVVVVLDVRDVVVASADEARVLAFLANELGHQILKEVGHRGARTSPSRRPIVMVLVGPLGAAALVVVRALVALDHVATGRSVLVAAIREGRRAVALSATPTPSVKPVVRRADGLRICDFVECVARRLVDVVEHSDRAVARAVVLVLLVLAFLRAPVRVAVLPVADPIALRGGRSDLFERPLELRDQVERRVRRRFLLVRHAALRLVRM